jgi:hypothetical protein
MLFGPLHWRVMRRPANRLLPQARILDNDSKLKSATVPLLNVRWVGIADHKRYFAPPYTAKMPYL